MDPLTPLRYFVRPFVRRKFRRDWNPVALQNAFQEAEQSREATAVFPELSEEQKETVLRRRWRLVYPGEEIPGEIELLRTLIPTSLKTEDEIRKWFHGCAEEARRQTLIIVNVSWSKHELYRRLSEAGLDNGLDLYDEETRYLLEKDIISSLSD